MDKVLYIYNMKDRTKVLAKREVLMKLLSALKSKMETFFGKPDCFEGTWQTKQDMNTIESKLDMVEWVLNYNYTK